MKPLSSKDWFGKASAALVLGFTLALAVSGLFKAAMGLKDTYFSTPGQFSMWIMGPVWAVTLSLSFLVASGRRAWVWLALANLVLWSLLWLIGGVAR